jgi:hypothetical protein
MFGSGGRPGGEGRTHKARPRDAREATLPFPFRPFFSTEADAERGSRARGAEP